MREIFSNPEQLGGFIQYQVNLRTRVIFLLLFLETFLKKLFIYFNGGGAERERARDSQASSALSAQSGA